MERLPVLPEELVEEAPAGRVGQRLEHLIRVAVHVLRIGD
jgi:hypothetical protein